MDQNPDDRTLIRKGAVVLGLIIGLLVVGVVAGMLVQFWHYWTTGS